MASGKTSSAARGVKGQQKDPQRINVMFLCDEWKSSKGGLSTFNREFAVNLAKTAKDSIKVHCYVSQSDEISREDAKQRGVNLITAKEVPGSTEPLDCLKIPPQELPNPDIVVGHGRKVGTPAFFIVQAAKCKWVHFVHVFCEDLGKYKIAQNASLDTIEENEKKHKSEIELCKATDLVVAVGSRLQQKYSRSLPNVKVEIITPGIIEKFSTESSQLVKDRSVVKNCHVFMFGRASFEDRTLKGYDIIANAIGSLGKMFELTFVGSSTGEHRNIEQWFLDNTDIAQDQLTIRSYCNDQDKLMMMFHESDLVALPSRTEGFGLVALEAISAGIPVLVTGKSGIAKALQEVEGGESVIVKSDDAGEWAQRIQQLSNKSPEERQNSAKLLRESYMKTFPWSSECERFKRMIQELHEVESFNCHCDNVVVPEEKAAYFPEQEMLAETDDKDYSQAQTDSVSDGEVVLSAPTVVLDELIRRTEQLKKLHTELKNQFIAWKPVRKCTRALITELVMKVFSSSCIESVAKATFLATAWAVIVRFTVASLTFVEFLDARFDIGFGFEGDAGRVNTAVVPIGSLVAAAGGVDRLINASVGAVVGAAVEAETIVASVDADFIAAEVISAGGIGAAVGAGAGTAGDDSVETVMGAVFGSAVGAVGAGVVGVCAAGSVDKVEIGVRAICGSAVGATVGAALGAVGIGAAVGAIVGYAVGVELGGDRDGSDVWFKAVVYSLFGSAICARVGGEVASAVQKYVMNTYRMKRVHHAIDKDRKAYQEIKAKEDNLGQSVADFAVFCCQHNGLVLSSELVEDEFRFLLDILRRTRRIPPNAAAEGAAPRSTLRHEGVNIRLLVSNLLKQLHPSTSDQEALTTIEKILDEQQECPNDEEIQRRIIDFMETKFAEACTSQL